MKILVYGAGNIGSLYAAKLTDAGHDVTILARGSRLQDIRAHGIVLQDFRTGRESTTLVKAVERLAAEDTYDLVLVILPRSSVSEVLPILASNQKTPNVMFFGNNASGPEEMIRALGRKRVLLGFPGAAGVPHDEAIRYLILDRREQPTTIGELDGAESSRIKAIEEALQSAGFPISICSNMDAWLKTHVSEIVPTAGALYMADCDVDRLKGSREALVAMIRAIREGHGVLSALGIPITPASHRIFRWIPEFLMVLAIGRKLDDDAWSIKIGHAAAARDEMKAIAGEFRELVQHSRVNTPAMNRLVKYLEDVDQSEIANTSRKSVSEPSTL